MKFFFFSVLLLAGIFAAAQGKTSTAKPSTALVASIAKGKVIYHTFCLACHQADGSGVPNLNPPLINTPNILGSKTYLIQTILNGSRGQVEIDGETYNNAMPPQTHLTDQQIADVLNYIRNSFGNKGSAVTPAEVKGIRNKSK